MLAPPTLAYGWVNSQSAVVAGCQRALNKFGDVAIERCGPSFDVGRRPRIPL